MSWTDIFYPGNPGRRDEVVSLGTQLKSLMEFNFDSTNDLIGLLNNHVEDVKKNPISTIIVDNGATVKANCQTLLDKMDEIMTAINKIDEQLSKQLDPEVYRQLKSPDLSFSARIATAKKAITAGLSVLATVAGVALIAAIKSGVILTKIVAAIGVIKTSAVASLVLGVLTMGIDMIASAIIGAVERDKLEDAIDELEKAVHTFSPASKEYNKTIIRVEVTLEIKLGVDA